MWGLVCLERGMFWGSFPPGWGWQPCPAALPIPCLPPAGFANILKILNKDSSREELLSFIQQFGSHYIAEALYGSEFSCTIHFPSKKVQQQLWLQYQKGEERGGNGQSHKCRLLFMLFSIRRPLSPVRTPSPRRLVGADRRLVPN